MNDQSIRQAIEHAINNAITGIVQEEAAGASKRVAERVRSEAAGIVARAIQFVSMDIRRDELVVTLKIPQKTS